MSKFVSFVLLLGISSSFLGIARAAAPVPDFTLESVSKSSELNGWLLYLTPPAKHHFNVKAPMKATIAAKKIDFIVERAKESQIVFERANGEIEASDTVEVSAFLCDDAKTFCIKKTVTAVLASVLNNARASFAVPPGAGDKGGLHAKLPQRAAQAAREQTLDVTPDDESVKVKKDLHPGATPARVPSKKDAHGFWNNDVSGAVKEAIQTKKPLLIDFYGIWCPPCNQFNESVFPTKKFQTAAKHFVLLKLDADQEASWEVKSHFKVGGYPTIVLAKVPASEEIKSLEEIDRIVGFFNAEETTARLNEAYAHRTQSLGEKLATAQANYLELLQKQIEVKFEKQEWAETMSLSDEGARANPADPYFRLVKLQASKKIGETPENIALFKEIWEKRAIVSVETLMRAEDFIVQNAEHFKKEQLGWAIDFINALSAKVNPATMVVEGHELSIADLDVMKIDVYEAMKDETKEKEARKSAIASYRKLIAYFHDKDSRGLNLELAYLLRQDGQIAESKTIYDTLIKKYPKEFTFYYAAAKLYLDIKELPKARDLAENAVKFSYGDNRLRAEDSLLKVMLAQGEKDVALKRGKEFLASAKDPKGYEVRTQRYIDNLQKTLKEIEGSK